jgi:hypothetical protein
LVVVPAAYDIFDDWQEYFKKKTFKEMLMDLILLLRSIPGKIIQMAKACRQYFKKR